MGDKVGEAVQVGRSVLLGSGVHEGRKVGLLVAGTKPDFVGVNVMVGVLLGTGLDVSVFVGMGVFVGAAGWKSLTLHPITESSKKNKTKPPHKFRFDCTVKWFIVSLYFLLHQSQRPRITKARKLKNR